MIRGPFPMGRMEYHGRRLLRHSVQKTIQVGGPVRGGLHLMLNTMFCRRSLTLQLSVPH